MAKVDQAIKRIRQETCPATYMADFDKEACLQVIEADVKEKRRLLSLISKWYKQLKTDGKNTKQIVAEEMKLVLNNAIESEIENDSI